MEPSEIELRRVLVKVVDCLTEHDLGKLKFIFSDEISRDSVRNTSMTGALDFFQQLLDRGKIDSQHLSNLINTLDDIKCVRAAQLLKNYQLQTSNSVIVENTTTLIDQLYTDMEYDKQSMHIIIPQDIDERSSEPQQSFLLDNNKNKTSRSTINKEINTKVIIKKHLFYSIPLLLIYTIILTLLLWYIIPKFQQQIKPLPVDNKNTLNQAQFCQPSPYERYFIKSLYTGQLIGVVNNTSDQGEKLFQWNDKQNQLCNHQWYFVPVFNRSNDKVYVIQSVYNRKVFDIPDGNPSNENQIHQWDISMNNVNQQFRLIYIPEENSCRIQSLATGKILNAVTKQFITQADFEINEKESTLDKNKTLWQLIPFDIDQPGDKLTDCPYVSSLNDLTVIKFGNVFGDDGGYSTDDSKTIRLTISHYISSISIVTSGWLNSMQFIYSSSNLLNKEPSKSGFIRGSIGIYNQNYRNETFNITERNPNERINRVYMIINVGKDDSKVSTRYIVGIQFHTTYNRTSPFYGSQQGQLFTEEYQGFVLGYVRGGAHMHIERLQFIWYKV